MASSSNVVIHAAAAVVFAAGAPAYTWQSGQFTGVITDTGVGDITLNLNANDGVAAAACAGLITPRGAIANWPRVAYGEIVHTSAVAKQILLSQEGAAGAISAIADINFDIILLKNDIL